MKTPQAWQGLGGIHDSKGGPMSGNSGGNVKAKPRSRSRKRTGDRAGTLKRELDGREVSLLRWLGIAWPPERRAKHINCPFPGHEDKNPSWRWDQRKKAWFCSKCGGGDILRAVQEMRGTGFLEACDIVERDFLGQTIEASPAGTAPSRVRKSKPGNPSPTGEDAQAGQEDNEDSADFIELAARAQQEIAQERDEEELSRQRAAKLWEAGVSVSNTLAETYFEKHRGILTDWNALSGWVRFHPALWCSERQGHYPAILFRVAASHDGELMTVHRLYLDRDGGKAKIQSPKKAYGDFKGGAIWFGKPIENGELVKAEGPENALVCFMAGHPFAAAGIGGANMKNVRAPEGIARILIAGDRGRGADGRKAGEDFAEDAALAGRKCKLGVRLTFHGQAKTQRQMGGLERSSSKRWDRGGARGARPKRALGGLARGVSLAGKRQRHRVSSPHREKRRGRGGRRMGMALFAGQIARDDAEHGQPGFGGFICKSGRETTSGIPQPSPRPNS